MDDMQAFDKQLASVVRRRVGPSESVDDLAVFDAVIAANRQKGWGFTMFSALKFVAASVIVALFGGFLLAGVFTTQHSEEVVPAAVSASPTTEATGEPTEAPATSVRTDILPGVELTVEEIEPGVFHVISDGVRTRFGGDTDFSDLVAVIETEVVVNFANHVCVNRKTFLLDGNPPQNVAFCFQH